MYSAKIYVTLKESVLDPQGKTIRSALEHLDFKNVEDVRLGKFFVVRLNVGSVEKAKAEVDRMCKKLLVNPVIETYSFEIEKEKK
jgi:phosphoribosylformylglycinamidine synthase subunit PurS